MNQVALDAIERHLEMEEGRRPVEGYGSLPVFHLGDIAPFSCADLYAERGR